MPKRKYFNFTDLSNYVIDCDRHQNFNFNAALDYKDENFEVLQHALIKHYYKNGTFEKLKRYYVGDEKPLRDDSNIWTTALSFSVNCTQKRLQVKFWKNPKMVLKYQW